MSEISKKPVASPALLRVGRILGAHGVRGVLKVHSFTQDPLALFSFPRILRKSGDFLLAFEGPATKRGTYKDAPFFLAKSPNITTRNAAEALRGVFLYVHRDTLPEEPKDTYYHADLKGLDVFTHTQQKIGTVISVQDFGAGPLLEIKPDTLNVDVQKAKTHTTEAQTDASSGNTQTCKAQTEATQPAPEKNNPKQQKPEQQESFFMRFHDSHVAGVHIKEKNVILTPEGSTWAVDSQSTTRD